MLLLLKQAVETIWKGDVTEFTAAYDLICIVDQIHQYAVTQHKDFVIQHLEQWHQRYKKIESDRDSDNPGLDDIAVFPEWWVVKEIKSREAAERKAALRRKHAADMREKRLEEAVRATATAAAIANGEDDNDEQDIPGAKRERKSAKKQQHAPKKAKEQKRKRDQDHDSVVAIKTPIKRGRGRPRKK